jgi:hypothetical protein
MEKCLSWLWIIEKGGYKPRKILFLPHVSFLPLRIPFLPLNKNCGTCFLP